MFIKYRTKWSSGPSSWKYMDIEDGEDIEDCVIREEGIDPDPQHWRGVEYKKISCPPANWLNEQIKYAKNTISVLDKKVERYEDLLQDLEMLEWAEEL